jgi:GDPmannose 4,6-dehydratase
MRRALITGISGQDGSYLAQRLLHDGYEVTGLVRSASAAASPNIARIADELILVPGNIAEPESLRAAIRSSDPDEIFHLAAPTSVSASWDDPIGTDTLIAGAAEILIEAAAALPNPPRIYVATSSEIFGEAGVSPQNEDSPKHPRTPYGESKLRAHELVAAARDRGLYAVSGITYNHESPRRPLDFLPRKVTNAAASISLGLTDSVDLGDLEAVRDWSHADDITHGAALALRAPEPADYVFASGVGRTVQDLVDAAFAAAGVNSEGRVFVNPAFLRPPEPTLLIGDPSRAEERLGWEHKISFEAMIAEMVAADLAGLRGY